ncbi:hypothetical protein CHS0354_040366 [Potamilus streckersoni]|uniref:SSD domain-containing protein n=1 Tax=Potamilus streckersoni TaxID=2493646 RepID=A0AAE0S1B6_9BIVA|nr:hypothetical protein CHS0354_040366 [Potamilus streckersoni]
MFGDRIYRKVDTAIGESFFKYGLFLARHPWKFLLASVAINCLLFLGLLNLRMETDAATIYTPMTSQSIKDSRKIQGMFPDVSGSSFQEYQKASFGLYAEVIVRAKLGNALNTTVLNEMKKLYTYIGSISLTYEGQTVYYKDFCARLDDTCAVGGDILLTPEFESLLAFGNVPYPIFFHPSKGPVYYKRFVGSPVINNSVLVSAPMMKLTFNFRTDEERYGIMFDIWKDEFIHHMNLFKSDVIDVAYAHVSSISEEIKNNILGDLMIFVASFTFMTLYIWLALCRPGRGCLGHRLPLGTAGLMATIMSIGSSIGLLSACGVVFVTDAAAMPFLLIGKTCSVNNFQYSRDGIDKLLDRSAKCINESSKGLTIGIFIHQDRDLYGILHES